MKSRLHHRLSLWRSQNLISDGQIQAILAYETQRKSGNFTKRLFQVAIWAILLGVLSLVAANWMYLSDSVKFSVHLIANSIVAAFILYVDEQKYPYKRDIALILFSGLCLTFIALIGQIFQLHGDIPQTLGFWFLIISPAILYFGRTYITGNLYILIGLIVLVMNFDALFKENITFAASVLLLFYLPLFLLGLSALPWFQRHRPAFVAGWRYPVLILPLIAAIYGTGLIGYNMDLIQKPHLPAIQFLLALGLIGLLIGSVVLKQSFKEDKNKEYLFFYLFVSGVVLATGFFLPTLYQLGLGAQILSALIFILYFMFVAWLGTRIQSSPIVDWAINLILLRLFIVYLEVFGSMAFTGIGLILSGALLLLILKFHPKIRKVFRSILPFIDDGGKAQS
jgi:uncharacterized membrane protein